MNKEEIEMELFGATCEELGKFLELATVASGRPDIVMRAAMSVVTLAYIENGRTPREIGDFAKHQAAASLQFLNRQKAKSN